jgi:phosphoglycerate dehydrogenase-like enzyme
MPTPSSPQTSPHAPIFGFDAFTPKEIAAKIEQNGVIKAKLPFLPMAMLGAVAGAFIGLGALYYTLVISDPELTFAASRVLGGVAFSLGLMLVIIGGAELFTGNNFLVMAWAEKKITTGDVVRNWVVVFLANGVGAIGLAMMVYLSHQPDMNAGKVALAAVKTASYKASLPFSTAFFKGVLCNLLVCLGVWVAMAPGGNSTAELAFGLMLAMMRRITQSDQAMRRGQWPMVLGYVLRGKTLGILGLGKIGTEVAGIARAFGMKVIAWGPTLTPERAGKSHATYTPLDDLLRQADVVSVHLALSDQSKNLLDENRLRLMKPSAYLINTARGAIVDEGALVRILHERAIAGAGLDVFVDEPLRPNHPLLQLDNVVLTPHLGWPTDSGFEGFAENAVTNILDYMDGKLTRVINPEAWQNRARRG